MRRSPGRRRLSLGSYGGSTSTVRNPLEYPEGITIDELTGLLSDLVDLYEV
jgi:hypothetical protein